MFSPAENVTSRLRRSEESIKRPPAYWQRLFVEHDLGESSGSAADAARRAGYPWTGQMTRKMLRNVEKRGVQSAVNGPSPPPTPAGVRWPSRSLAWRIALVQGNAQQGPPTLRHQCQLVQEPLSLELNRRLVVKGRSLYPKGLRRRWPYRKPLRPFGYRLLNEAASRWADCLPPMEIGRRDRLPVDPRGMVSGGSGIASLS